MRFVQYIHCAGGNANLVDSIYGKSIALLACQRVYLDFGATVYVVRVRERSSVRGDRDSSFCMRALRINDAITHNIELRARSWGPADMAMDDTLTLGPFTVVYVSFSYGI